MKKTICLLLALLLTAAAAACGAKTPEAPENTEPSGQTVPADAGENGTPEPADAEEPVTIDQTAAGVSFDLPAWMQNIHGVIQAAYGGEIETGAGLYIAGLQYCAMTREKFEELLEKQNEFSQEDVDFIRARIIDLMLVYAFDGGRTLEDAAEQCAHYGLPTSGCRHLATVGEYSFYVFPDPERDVLDSLYTFDEGFREEYDGLAAACAEADWIRCYEPESLAPETGGTVTFQTTDLNGDPVTSQELFGAHRLTMVNLWGTFCGPCIGEMPDLAELSTRLEEKDCGIVGVVVDATGRNQAELIETAKEIVADTGVEYRNLLPWDGIESAMPAQYIPTTYFVDSSGRLVGEAAVGARGADEYEALIDAALAALGE